MITKDKTNSLDIIKVVACILIVGSHALPLFSSKMMNFYYGQWLFRFCVPFFFMVSGFYYYEMSDTKKKKYIERIALLYGAASILYLPLHLTTDIKGLIINLIYGWNHLWYLSALAISLLLLYFLERILKKQRYILGIILLFCGIFFDEYYQLFSIESLKKVIDNIEYIGGARSALFFGVPMLLVGELISENKIYEKIRTSWALIIFILTYILAFGEVTFLRGFLGDFITVDISLCGWMPAFALVVVGLRVQCNLLPDTSRFIRKTLDVVYVIHVWIILIIGKLLRVKGFWRFILAIIVSFVCAYIYNWVLGKIKGKR